MIFARAVVLVIGLASTVKATAFDDVEHYLDLQTGSLMGLVHASYGAKIGAHNFLAGIGYVPKLSYHSEMMLYSLRYRYDHSASWDVAGMKLSPFNFGAGLLIGDHSDLYTELPDRYPSGYYTPTAFRIVFNYQATLQVTESWKAYFDMSILDVGLIGYIREPEFFNDNYRYFGLEGITNWGVGARYAF